jgi:hypothetical protein
MQGLIRKSVIFFENIDQSLPVIRLSDAARDGRIWPFRDLADGRGLYGSILECEEIGRWLDRSRTILPDERRPINADERAGKNARTPIGRLAAPIGVGLQGRE